MHNKKDHVACIKDFYREIINSEMRTYRNSKDDPAYIIRFAYLEALIELLNCQEESALFRDIYSTGLEKIDHTLEEVYERFERFFKSFKNSKKNTAIIEDMHKLYPSETSRLSDEQWHKMFPEEKQYKRDFIAKTIRDVMHEMVGADIKEDEDIEE